jgi:hypothetical protein
MSSNTKELESKWTSLWKVHVPSKIRVFLWRLAKHSLPTADVIRHRNMMNVSACHICGAPDSWRHSLLLECMMAKCTWALVDDDITDLMCSTQEQTAWEWLFTMIAVLKHEQLTRMLVTLWAIWHARCKAIHEDKFQSPLSNLCFINDFLADLHAVDKEKKKGQKSDVAVKHPKWIAPSVGSSKINVDAAIGKNTKVGSVAAVARDCQGNYLGASAVVFQHFTDPQTLEALACRESLALASDLMLQKITIACDCLAVVNSSRSDGMETFGHIIKEIQARSLEFRETSFVHENRASNVEAHSLARSAIYLATGRHVWLTVTPDGVCTPLNILHQ